MNDERSKIVKDRLSRSRAALKAAELLIENHFEEQAINRLYYACFYAVSAILLQLGFKPSTHSGVRSLFGLHIIHNGLMPEEYGDLFVTLFEARHKTDYSDLVEIDPRKPRMGTSG